MTAELANFHEVRVSRQGSWDKWHFFQLTVDGVPKVVPIINCYKAREALTWLVENNHYHHLVNGEPLYYHDANVVPAAFVSYYGVDGTAWFFDDADVAMLFKLTWA
jgi:hypothetical protein